MGTETHHGRPHDGVTCVIQARDAAATIERALRSVAWADEILVADMGSADETVSIARRFTDRILEVPVHPRVDGVRNACVAQATHEWILVLDADEYLAADAGAEIRSLIATRGRRWDVFRVPRFNHIAGQVMRGSRWYPDYQTRLFRQGTVRWSDTNHQTPETRAGSRVFALRPPHCLHLHHQHYRTVRELLERQTRYALTDTLDTDPASFDFASYLADAHQEFALRDDRARDGDLSHALAHVRGWDAIVRGLLHWHALNPRPPLRYRDALGAAARQVERPRWRLRRWFARRAPVAYRARQIAAWMSARTGAGRFR